MRRAIAVATVLPIVVVVFVGLACRSAAPPATAPVAREPERHGHSDGCGHFFENGIWREWPAKHSHGAGCGHVRNDLGYGFFPAGHEHGPSCGHFLVDGAWQPFAREHVHGEGCGHSHFDGMWNPFPPGHVHDSGCGHELGDGGWKSLPSDPGHVHAPGCGHRPLGDGVWLEAGERTARSPRGIVRGLFRHGGGFHATKRGALAEWTIECGDDAGSGPLASRPGASPLGGAPVLPRD